MALTPPGGIPRTTDDIDFTGAVRVNSGSAATGFSIADPTDATKVLIFDCSGITTGTTNTFAPAAGGTEVTVDGTQTLTNKKFSDSTCTFADNADLTKQLAFECSGITTATTRTITIPNSNGTIAYLAGSTLTTATLTSPAINTPTVTGGTYSAPALTAPTVATSLLITSTTGALGIPVMTEVQRDALTPSEGWLIYNVTTHKLNVRVAAAWEVITSA